MMRSYFLLMILLAHAYIMQGQKMPQDYYDEAQAESFRKNDSVALADYAYFVGHYPNNKLCSEAYYRMGDIYARDGHEMLAIGAYRASFLAVDNKLDDLYYSVYGGKPAAARRLTDIYEKNGNYDSALYFLYQFDTGFTKFYGCGNEAAGDQQQTVLRYADLNLKAGRPRAAEQALLSMNVYGTNLLLGFEGNSEVVKRLKKLFEQYEDKGMLKSEMEHAVTHYFMDSVYHQRDDIKDTTIYMCYMFLGVKVRYRYKYLLGNVHYKIVNSDPIDFPEDEKITTRLKKLQPYLIVQDL